MKLNLIMMEILHVKQYTRTIRNLILYQLLDLGQIEIADTVSEDVLTELQVSLSKYGIQIIDNPKGQLIKKLKMLLLKLSMKR
jgi:hypothetical protein